jgi:hypothetical protein
MMAVMKLAIVTGSSGTADYTSTGHAMDKYPGLCSLMTGSIFAGNICSVIHLIDQSTWLTLARPSVGSSSPRTCILLEF